MTFTLVAQALATGNGLLPSVRRQVEASALVSVCERFEPTNDGGQGRPCTGRGGEEVQLLITVQSRFVNEGVGSLFGAMMVRQLWKLLV